MRIFLHQSKAILWFRRPLWVGLLVLQVLPSILLFFLLVHLTTYLSEPVREGIFPKENVFTKFPKSAAVNFLYSPKDAFFDELMKNVVRDLDVPNSEYIGFKNQQEVEIIRQFAQQNDSNIHVLGIIFKNDNESNQFSYKMMFKNQTTGSIISKITNKIFRKYGIVNDIYITSGMITLQYALDKNYIEMKAKKKVDTKFFIQKFPRQESHTDKGTILMWKILHIFTCIACFPIFCILGFIGDEKETGIQEFTVVMGLKRYVMWFTWFVYALLPALISITIIVVLVKLTPGTTTGPILRSNPLILFIHLLLHYIASIIWIFALCALIRPELHSSICALALCSIIFAHLVTQPLQWNVITVILSVLLPNVTLFLGCELISSYEAYGVAFGGFTSRNNMAGHEMTMIEIWAMFLVETFLYSIILSYSDAVCPGKYGRRKSWLFPCKMLTPRKTNRVEAETRDSTDRSDRTNFEEVSSTLTPGIEIINLTKAFGNDTVAVAGITLDIYKDHITVLLGHNGAGKSVTMQMLAGMLTPTSGQIKINGYDMKYDLSKIHESLGLCPQSGMFYEEYTVKEHLMLFTMLRGLKKTEALEETNKLLADLQLSSHQNDVPPTLSGGMKRRLSLGISLCGKPNVLILDEPTSGLDPELRRRVWNILLSMRGQRTILITTHDMEEADVLGDYVAIMDHGLVKCYGTPMFLKDIYGTGYHLEITTDGPNRHDDITQLVQRVIPVAAVRTKLPAFIVYNIPSAEKAKFPSLFKLLEDNKKTAGITHIGFSLATMEEVFLKVGENEDDDDEEREEPPPMMISELEGTPLQFQKQLMIMLLKNILIVSRIFILFICVVILILILTFFIAMSQRRSEKKNHQTVDHRLDMFGVTKVLYKDDAENSSLAKHYENITRQTGSSVERVSTTIIEALLSVGEENYKYPHHIVAADFQASNNSRTALYSGNSEISVSVSVNLITSALLKDSTNSDERAIEVQSQLFKDSGKVWGWLYIVMSLILWMVYVSVIALEETLTEFKHLQSMTGIAPIAYWLMMYIWDSLLNLVLNLLILATACIEYRHMYSGSEELCVVFCIFTAYGLSAIPLIYLSTYLKKCEIVEFCILFPFFVAYFLHWILASYSSKSTANNFSYIFSFIPYYAVFEAVDFFTDKVNANNECTKMTKRLREMVCVKFSKCCACTDDMCTENRSPYIQLSGEDNKLFRLLLTMVFSAFLYFGLILFIERGLIQRMIARRMIVKKERSSNDTAIDWDVIEEEENVERALKEMDSDEKPEKNLLVWKLNKIYCPDRTAVESVSFMVKPGECFGLLGVNGAGKTTVIKMLTGSIVVAQGDAVIYKWHLSKERTKFLAQIGYCPQTDGLLPFLTPWDHITLFARLRGLTKMAAQMESEMWVNVLGLQEFRDKPSEILSGGTLRKVSIAVALVGNPFLLILDEPTTGVDPVSRRKLWNVLKNVHSNGRCLVLTSHSMYECEMMCDRLTIMVNGRFQCLGDIHHLREKFSQGYNVKLKLNLKKHSEENVVNLKRVLNNLESGSTFVLKDEHKSLLHYHVVASKISLSKIFKMMEDLKSNYTIIQDYSIAQTTLEEIFVAFAAENK